MSEKTDPRVMMVLAASNKEAGRRSPLFKWMTDNHALLAAEFAANGPQWVARTHALAEAGLVDAEGKAPTQRTAMQTWYRVCRTKSASQPKRRSVPNHHQPIDPTAKEAMPVPSLEPAADDDEERWNRLGFRPVGGPKDWTKS